MDTPRAVPLTGPATVIAFALVTGCHRRPPPPTLTPPSGGALPPGESPATPVEPWCFTPRPLADLRAIDPHGHVWSIRNGRITDETTGVVSPLASELPCPARGGWAFEFSPDGSAYALVDSRFYLRSTRDGPFAVTAMCTDVQGAPWSRRAEGGWSFVARTWPANGPGLMLTNDRSGESGWYAVTALDTTLTSAVLDPDRSMVLLANGGHLLFIDQTRVVAGEVLASHGALFTGLGRSVGGVVAFRDDGPAHRVLVTSGGSVQRPFAQTLGHRPPGGDTTAVFLVDVARIVAVTDHGVELSTNRGQDFSSVLETPVPLHRVTFGWIAGAHPALATPTGIVSDRCILPGPDG